MKRKRTFTPEQREAQLKRQREWNIKYAEKRKLLRQEKKELEALERDFVPPIKKENSLSKILEVLRKNNKSFLWNITISKWKYKEWNEYQKLKL